jgi:hypothetical protein
MPVVPLLGVLSYNGYSNFSAYTKCTSLECRPVPDSTNRTTVYNEYTVAFHTTITGAACATEIPRMRAALSKNGGPLIISGLLATGDVFLNIGTVRDVSWGPWVDSLRFDPSIGGRRAAALDWTLRFRVPECADAKYLKRPMDYSWVPTYTTDDCGYSTRSIAIRLRIPQNRIVPGAPIAQDSLDDYVELVLPPEIPGFRRTFGPREYSADRTEMRWSCTDTEFEYVCPPPGVVKETASVSFTSDGSAGFVWNGVINYSCELPKGGTLPTALAAAEDLIQDRRKQLGTLNQGGAQAFGGGGGGGNLQNVPVGKAVVIPLSWSITEPEVFGRRKYDISVTFTFTTTREELLNNGGLWRPAPNRGNWRLWSLSLQDTALDPRGYADLTFDAGGDGIVDLCGNGIVRTSDLGADAGVKVIPGRLKGGFPPCQPENSWHSYTNRVYLEQESGVTGMRTLPKKSLDSDTDRGGTVDALGRLIGGGGGGGAVGGGIPFQPPLPPPGGGGGRLDPTYTDKGGTSARRVRRPQQWVIMEGSAVRVGYEVPEPKLVDINGIKLLPCNRPDAGEGFRQWPVFCNGIQTTYRAEWKLRYLPESDLPDKPLPQPPNPTMGV